MPKMYLHAPARAFDDLGRLAVARDLTELGLRCERIPETPSVKSTVWLYFQDYAAGMIFKGGEVADTSLISLIFYTLKGGLDEEGRRTLIAGATAIIGRYAKLNEPGPAYVVVHEIPEADWGLFGKQADLDALRNPSDASP